MMRKAVRILQGLFLAYLITGIVLLIFSFLMYQLEWGEKAIRIGIIITYIVSTVIGGFYIGRKVQTRRLLFGIAFGIAYIAVICIASLLLYPGEPVFSGNFVTIAGMCIGGGILGGILS